MFNFFLFSESFLVMMKSHVWYIYRQGFLQTAFFLNLWSSLNFLTGCPRLSVPGFFSRLFLVGPKGGSWGRTENYPNESEFHHPGTPLVILETEREILTSKIGASITILKLFNQNQKVRKIFTHIDSKKSKIDPFPSSKVIKVDGWRYYLWCKIVVRMVPLFLIRQRQFVTGWWFCCVKVWLRNSSVTYIFTGFS